MTRKEGYIDVNKMLQEIGVDTTNIYTILNSPLIKIVSGGRTNKKFVISFDYEDETYYCKYDKDTIPYNELIAFFLAQDFGLPCIEYDLAIIGKQKGVLSKDFKEKDVKYIYGEDILADFYKKGNVTEDIEKYNNLEGIWDALEYRYQNLPNKQKIIQKLMKRIVEIFLFDIICANYDRHCLNWGITESKNNIDIIPLLDNEGILSTEEEYIPIILTINEKIHENLWDALKEFLRVSSNEFKNIIQEKLWIISGENIKSIIKRIEEKTGYPMPEGTKDYYLKEFKKHREKLERLLEKEKNIERDAQQEGKKK